MDYLFIVAKKGSEASVPGSSCQDILISGDAQGDGEYWIDPTASGDPFKVFCDMATDGGKKVTCLSQIQAALEIKQQEFGSNKLSMTMYIIFSTTNVHCSRKIQGYH